MRRLRFERQAVPLEDKARWTHVDRLDLVVEGAIVVEIQVVDPLLPIHKA